MSRIGVVADSGDLSGVDYRSDLKQPGGELYKLSDIVESDGLGIKLCSFRVRDLRCAFSGEEVGLLLGAGARYTLRVCHEDTRRHDLLQLPLH